MKHFFTASLVGLVLSTSAFSMDELNIKVRDRDAAYLSTLPALDNTQVVIKMPPPTAAALPTAYVTFDHYSCAKRSFVAEVKETANVLFVAIKDLSQADCESVPKKHSYKIQIASDNPQKSVIVLNPPVQRVEMWQQPRMCTQNAGRLFNPQTGLCAGFSNGCEEREMLDAGFIYTDGSNC